MHDDTQVSEAEQRFFNALLNGDGAALEQAVTPDFVLIDVMKGSEIPAAALAAVVGGGLLKFTSVQLLKSRIRYYGDTAIVTGKTRMSGAFEGNAFSVNSSYTHVFVAREGAWRLASAQGTPTG